MTNPVLGKAAPTPDDLARAADDGFEQVELYLEPQHLETLSETADNCVDAAVDVSVIHTPHVHRESTEYLTWADELASEVEAEYIVVHSAGIPLMDAHEIEQEIEFTTPHGYEADPGTSLHHIKNAVFEQDLEFVFDIAHLWMATPAFRRGVRTLFTEPFVDNIGVVHLSDATPVQDGLPFGDGEIDIGWVVEQVQRDYDGPVVLEVMPDNQADALAQWQRRTENKDKGDEAVQEGEADA